jgi:hypothetical protein
VTVIHRRDSLRASKIMRERAFGNPKIKFRWNSEVTEILGDKKITGLRLRDTVTGEESTLEVGGTGRFDLPAHGRRLAVPRRHPAAPHPAGAALRSRPVMAAPRHHRAGSAPHPDPPGRLPIQPRSGPWQRPGLAHATDLDGGFDAWAAAGLPVTPGARASEASSSQR